MKKRTFKKGDAVQFLEGKIRWKVLEIARSGQLVVEPDFPSEMGTVFLTWPDNLMPWQGDSEELEKGSLLLHNGHAPSGSSPGVRSVTLSRSNLFRSMSYVFLKSCLWPSGINSFASAGAARRRRRQVLAKQLYMLRMVLAKSGGSLAPCERDVTSGIMTSTYGDVILSATGGRRSSYTPLAVTVSAARGTLVRLD